MGNVVSFNGLRNYYGNAALYSGSPGYSVSEWTYTPWNLSPSYSTKVFYIVSPAFYINLHNYFNCSGNVISLAGITLYKYNGSSWSEVHKGAVIDYSSGLGDVVASIARSAFGNVYTQDFYFCHNCDLSTSISEDKSKNHLWKIVIEASLGKGPVASVSNRQFYMEYQLYPAFSSHCNYSLLSHGGLLKRCNLGFYDSGDYTDSGFISAQTPGKRGELITTSSAKRCLTAI